MQTLSALICGIVFGAGLALSGMTNPAKVLAFLDVSGSWDPTLALVMAGALAINAAAYALTRRRSKPLFAGAFSLSAHRKLDAPLLGGAALFGVGWGLGGLCPGPALANLARGEPRVVLFIAAMAVGMLVQRRGSARLGRSRQSEKNSASSVSWRRASS
jgi:uncharacterized membrane protein YedE/YeeE